MAATVNLDDRGIHTGVIRVGIARQSLENPRKNIGLDPIAIPPKCRVPLAKLGRQEEARVAAARVLELQPTFRYSRQFAGVNCAPALAECLGAALASAGLSE